MKIPTFRSAQSPQDERILALLVAGPMCIQTLRGKLCGREGGPAASPNSFVLEWKTSKEWTIWARYTDMKFWARMACINTCWRYLKIIFFFDRQNDNNEGCLDSLWRSSRGRSRFFLHKRVSLKCWNHHFSAARVSTKDAMSLVGHVFKVRITFFCPLGGNIVDFALGCNGSHENEKHPGTKNGFPPQHNYRVVVGASFFPFGEVHFCSCDSL